MSRLPKRVYTSNGISIKLPMAFFSFLNLYGNIKDPQIPKTI